MDDLPDGKYGKKYSRIMDPMSHNLVLKHIFKHYSYADFHLVWTRNHFSVALSVVAAVLKLLAMQNSPKNFTHVVHLTILRRQLWLGNFSSHQFFLLGRGSKIPKGSFQK